MTETFYAYAYDPTDNCRHIYNMIRMNDLLRYPDITFKMEPDRIANQLKVMPPGKAALFEPYFGAGYGSNFHPNQVRGHAEDALPSGKENIKYKHGTNKLRERCIDYYGSVKAYDPPLNFISLESDKCLFTKRIDRDHAIELAEHNPDLVERLGFDDLYTGHDENGTRARLLQRELFRAYWTALHNGGYQHIADMWPGLQMANWYAGIVNQRFASPGRYRLRPMVVGTHAAPATYGTSRYGTDAFTALQADVNQIKSNEAWPISPWVCHKYGFARSKLNYSQYWHELIYHAALNGTDFFQFWNPITDKPDIYGTPEELEKSAKTMANTLVELNRHDIVKFSSLNRYLDSGNTIISGAKTKTGNIYRLTASEPGEYQVLDKAAVIEPGNVGTWIY